MKTAKKTWIKPAVEAVALESEEDVLRACRTPSHALPGNGTCGKISAPCAAAL